LGEKLSQICISPCWCKIQPFYLFIAEVYDSINIMKKRINKPNVKRQIKGMKFIRSGRGFSKSELSEAGISNTSTAKNNGIPIDMLRKTKNPENVEQLKSIAKDLLNLKKIAEQKG
jgi:ribosomal protein L13E